MPTYTVSQRFNSRVERSPRVIECAEAFGIGLDEKEFVVYDNLELTVDDGAIVFITGESGSGKSLLLKDLRAQMLAAGKKVADLDSVEYSDKPLVEQVGKSTDDAIRILSAAGLNDAHLFVRKPSELSDGQRYRFAIALLMNSDAEVWTADEFTAFLDRETARVLCFNLQKLARKVGVTVLLATTHGDMIEELAPDVTVVKRYKSRVEVNYGG
jgi:hypothetical protein